MPGSWRTPTQTVKFPTLTPPRPNQGKALERLKAEPGRAFLAPNARFPECGQARVLGRGARGRGPSDLVHGKARPFQCGLPTPNPNLGASLGRMADELGPGALET